MEWVPFLWLMVALKIPLAALLWIVWWALKSEPAPEDERPVRDDGDGPDHPRPRRPRPPRRGPHASPSPPAPKRVRVRSRRRTPVHR